MKSGKLRLSVGGGAAPRPVAIKAIVALETFNADHFQREFEVGDQMMGTIELGRLLCGGGLTREGKGRGSGGSCAADCAGFSGALKR